MDKLYEKIVENLYDGIYFVDTQRKITFWNSAAERLTGYSKEEVTGQFCFDNLLDHIDTNGKHLCFGGCPLQKSMDDGVQTEGAVFLKRKDGERIPVVVKVIPVKDDAGIVTGAIEIFNDNYQEFKILSELSLFKGLAFKDNLTGLSNRHYVEEFTKENKSFVEETVNVLFADIDNFKDVNDTYGHAHGDTVLKVVSSAMQASLKKSDEVFRYGGEEFMAVIFESDFDNVKAVAERLRKRVETLVIRCEDKLTPVTISIGITTMNLGEDFQSVVDRADKLMFKSKVAGKNQVTFK